MIAKLAKFHMLGRGAALRADPTAAPCNDNHRGRRQAPAKRLRPRRVLVCHWYKAANGALECRWHEGSAADRASDIPGISRRRDQLAHAARRNGTRALRVRSMQPLLQDVA